MRSLCYIVLFFVSGICHAELEERDLGVWLKQELVLVANSNWGAEHCVRLPAGYTVSYTVSAETPLTFEFHVHPDMPDGSYHTEHLAHAENTRDKEGSVDGDWTGNYCFHFFRTSVSDTDKKILLSYKIE